MARRRAAKRGHGLRWLVLIGLAVSAVVFARAPESQPPGAGEAPTSARDAQPPRAPSRERSAEPASSPFFRSALACERALRERSRRRAGAAPRVGTWNLRWFPRGTARGSDQERRTDVRWMACAIASLEVDVLAVQEVLHDAEGRAALLDLRAGLDALTGGRWRAELDPCSEGRQHVGLLYDERAVTLRGVQAVAALNPGRSACDRNLRPGLAAQARFADGSRALLIAVHLDSGVTPRDHDNRRRSVERLGAALTALQPRERARDVIVLGDFNTMGCRDCVPAVRAEDELASFDAALAGQQLKRLSAAAGAGCSQYYRGHAGLLDHVLVGERSRWARASLQAFGPCAELACAAHSRTRAPAAFARLSDHCPLVAAARPATSARGRAARGDQ